MDEEVELTYIVTIRTYGDAEKLKLDMGDRLAKICELSFMDVSVSHDYMRALTEQTTRL